VRRAAWLLLLLATVAAACHTQPLPESAPATTHPEPTPLHEGPLVDYVPAAGLHWMLVGRPRELAETPGVTEALAPIFSSARLDAFASTTGVDLRKTPSALVARFDYATLYLAEPTDDSYLVETLFLRRLVRGAQVKTPHPKLRTVLGVIGETPESLVSVRGKLVAVSVGDPTPARVVEAYARGRLKRSPTALHGAALSTLPSEIGTAPLCFYVPGPFEGEWARAGRGLFATATAVAVTVASRARGRIAVELVLAGDYRSDEPATTMRLADAWRDLVASETGKLLGLDQPGVEPAVTAARDQLRLQVELSLVPVVTGVHAAVSGDVDEIMGGVRPPGPPSQPETPSPATDEK
jgi:hypothetical protein